MAMNASVATAENGAENCHYFRWQIIEMAKGHGYFANTNDYKSWSRLLIFTGNFFEVVFSVHDYGHQDNGVMAVSGFTFERIPSEEHSVPTQPKPSHPDLFQFNYRESEADIFKRFDEWLEQAITLALAQWEKTLG